eukprot:1993856-Amphidinium_carterae.1
MLTTGQVRLPPKPAPKVGPLSEVIDDDLVVTHTEHAAKQSYMDRFFSGLFATARYEETVSLAPRWLFKRWDASKLDTFRSLDGYWVREALR